MKNKQFLLYFVSGCIPLLGLFLLPTFDYAQALTSEAALSYEKNNSAVLPVDPTNPKNSLDTNTVKPGTNGTVTIDYLSDWSFEVQQISTANQVYQVSPDVIQLQDGTRKKVAPFFQITDKSGENNGWSLMIEQEKPFMNDHHALKGTQIKLNIGKWVSPDDGRAPKISKETVTIFPEGGLVLLAKAEAEEGTGTWLGIFEHEKQETAIQLVVPGNSEKKAGKYRTSFRWTLVSSEI